MEYLFLVGRRISGISCLSGTSYQWNILSHWDVVSVEYLVSVGRRINGTSYQWDVVSVEYLVSVGRLQGMLSQWIIASQ